MEEAKWCEQVFEWIVNHWTFCAFFIGIIFEVPKWKLKPFTALFNWISGMIIKPVVAEIDVTKKKIDDLTKEVEALKKDVDTNEMDTIRSAVLDFANTCRNGRGHSKEEFDHIIAPNDKYEQLLGKYGIRNGVYEVDYRFILGERDRCQRENSYLA